MDRVPAYHSPQALLQERYSPAKRLREFLNCVRAERHWRSFQPQESGYPLLPELKKVEAGLVAGGTISSRECKNDTK